MKYSLLITVFIIFQFSFCQTRKGFDLKNASIPVSEIKDGGPPKDGIPSIDSPQFVTAEKASLKPGDRVLGIFENGIAKAYPIKILNFHEIVNDKIGEKPIVVTYCPLCGSGIVFDAKIDGKLYTFGVSGLLYNSDVLLYDRQTESLWSQLEYKAISGPMEGKSLEIINTANTTWESWKNRYLNTLVLSEDTGYKRDYDLDPYPDYNSSSAIYFPVANENNEFHPKEMVIGVEVKGKFKAYPFSELEKTGKPSIHDTFNKKKISIHYDARSKSAEIFDARGKPIPAVTNFWFAWYAFHPETAIYRHK